MPLEPVPLPRCEGAEGALQLDTPTVLPGGGSTTEGGDYRKTNKLVASLNSRGKTAKLHFEQTWTQQVNFEYISEV